MIFGIRRKNNPRGASTYVASHHDAATCRAGERFEREAHSPLAAFARLVGALWFERRIARRAGCPCGAAGEPECIADRREADAFIDTFEHLEAVACETRAAVREAEKAFWQKVNETP